jgi:DNA-binding MarR family transcriptional regulator
MSRAETELAEALFVAVHHVGRVLRILDAELGLSPVRSDVLGALAFHPPMSVGELARYERVASPSMTRLLVDMEKAGLIRRRPDPGDARRLLAELTDEGRSLIGQVRNRKIALFTKGLARSPSRTEDGVSAVIDALESIAAQR